MSSNDAVLSCPECRSRNRVLVPRLFASPRCGRCHRALGLPAEPVVLDDASFEDVVTAANVPVIVDFWAPWCGPCRTFAPTLAQFAAETAGSSLVAKVNVDEAKRTAERHHVQGVPTIVVMREGRESRRAVGALSLTELRDLAASPDNA